MTQVSKHSNFFVKIAFFSCLLLIPNLAHSYKGIIGLSLDAGYGNLPVENVDTPTSIHGGTGRIRGFYGLSESFGIEVQASAMLFGDFTPKILVQNPDEEEEMYYESLPKVKKTQVKTSGVGIIYAFDILRLIPYIALGISGVSTGIKYESEIKKNYDFALYLDFAAEYQLTHYFWLGMVGTITIPITNNSTYLGGMGGLLRVTYVWKNKNLK